MYEEVYSYVMGDRRYVFVSENERWLWGRERIYYYQGMLLYEGR